MVKDSEQGEVGRTYEVVVSVQPLVLGVVEPLVLGVGKEKVCYWLSNDIVGLVGNLAV